MPLTIQDFQARVGAWHSATFGDGKNPVEYLRGFALKLGEETEEFGKDFGDGEIADLFVLCCGMAYRKGVSLAEIAAEKMTDIESRPDMIERSRARGAYLPEDTHAENALRILGFRPMREQDLQGRNAIRMRISDGSLIRVVAGEGESDSWADLAGEMLTWALYEKRFPYVEVNGG